MTVCTINFSNDPIKLGSDATQADLDKWIANVVDFLEKSLDLTIVYTTGSHERDHSPDNHYVDNWLRATNQGDGWLSFL